MERVTVTGQLGDIMTESVHIAYTFARQFVRKLDAGNEFFQWHQLHLHCPEGAVGKDGPSAGEPYCLPACLPAVQLVLTLTTRD